MNLETEYKNIQFKISIEKEIFHDVSILLGDKFNRLPAQAMIEIKKGSLAPYNLFITSIENDDMECIHYLNGILLTTNEDELIDELSSYLEQEEILDKIEVLRKKYYFEPGPIWRI
jgi:hypothetical protein